MKKRRVSPSWLKAEDVLCAGRAAGFSLIEVVIALGIISFALVAVIGLLPTGLSSQREAVNQAFGTQALNDVAQAVQGIYLTNGVATFPPPIAAVPVTPGGTVNLPLYEDGSLTNSAATRMGTVFIAQRPLLAGARPVFVSVAWPQTAAHSGDAWTNARGSMSILLFLPQ